MPAGAAGQLQLSASGTRTQAWPGEPAGAAPRPTELIASNGNSAPPRRPKVTVPGGSGGAGGHWILPPRHSPPAREAGSCRPAGWRPPAGRAPARVRCHRDLVRRPTVPGQVALATAAGTAMPRGTELLRPVIVASRHVLAVVPFVARQWP